MSEKSRLDRGKRGEEGKFAIERSAGCRSWNFSTNSEREKRFTLKLDENMGDEDRKMNT